MNPFHALREHVEACLREMGAEGMPPPRGVLVLMPDGVEDVQIPFFRPVAQDLGAIELRIVEAIRQRGEPMVAKEIAQAVILSESTVKKYAPLMVRAGILVKITGQYGGGYGLPGMKAKNFPP